MGMKVGETVQGRVTNIYRRRVWVDIGAASDASFTASVTYRQALKVGDVLEGLTVVRVDLENGQVQVKAPNADAANSKPGNTKSASDTTPSAEGATNSKDSKE